jgi:ABC-2 type transport system ATP-binding protein
MTAILVNSITKAFNDHVAVDDVSFSVGYGEIFGLLGPNGAGKTTTIRVILDIFKPDSGEVSIFGGALDEKGKNRIGYLPEERGLYRDLQLEPTLHYLATLKGMESSAARNALHGWLERFDLWDHRHKKIQDLSRGMQQKAQIIATFLHNPDLVIVDEPFSGLDPVNTRLIKRLIEEQCRQGKTIVMSTHQMYQVEAMCNRIILIDSGQSVLYGEVNEIKSRFAGNAVRIEANGDLSGIPGVLETRRQNSTWHLTLRSGTSPQDIFQSLANRENIKVERFEIAEPSLDDIFVSVVEQRRQGSARE